MNISQYGCVHRAYPHVAFFEQPPSDSNALVSATTDPIDGLYTTNTTAPLGANAGLRQLYAWGFYDFCAYTAVNQGICSNTSVGHTFRPFDSLVADVPLKFRVQTEFIIPSGSFTNSVLLASLSRSGYFLCLIATILAGLAMFMWVHAKMHLPQLNNGMLEVA